MYEITSASHVSSIADDCQTSYHLRLPLPTKFWGMNTMNSSQSRWSPKRQRSWEFVRYRQDVPTSTMKEIFYVKANGWCGCVGFVFLSDGDSYIAKKSLSKINPTSSSSTSEMFIISDFSHCIRNLKENIQNRLKWIKNELASTDHGRSQHVAH